jgi:hypothetical protein
MALYLWKRILDSFFLNLVSIIYGNTHNKKTFRNVTTIQQGREEDLCYCSFDGEEAISLISRCNAGIILCKKSLKEVQYVLQHYIVDSPYSHAY